MGCRVGKLPFIYLGLQVGRNPRLKKFWTTVVKKIKRRLARWGRKFLSMDGGLTLIKSVLVNLPMYYLSLFILPRGVARKMEILIKKFKWGDQEAKRKVH